MRSRLIPLAAMAALAALPAAADASSIRSERGVIRYAASPGEANNPRITQTANGYEIFDGAGAFAGPGCRPVSTTVVRCDGVATAGDFRLGDGNDSIAIDAVLPSFVNGEAGDDRFLGGRAPGVSKVRWIGGPGIDTATYVTSRVGVRVTKNELFDDGRPGDTESVARDVERVEGTPAGDVIVGGGSGIEVFDAGAGDDQVFGLDGEDHFVEGFDPNGSDLISGGDGRDLVTYENRRQPVRVTLDGIRDDGATGELDNVDRTTESVFGSPHNDVLIGNTGFNALHGRLGNDTIDGLGGGQGIENRDIIFCGAGNDRPTRRRNELTRDCEFLGTFALSPRSATARRGAPVTLKLRWTHPEAWSRLKTVELRLRAGKREVGRVAFHPRRRKATARGRLDLDRFTIERGVGGGKAVEARVTLSIDAAPGSALTAELAASDTRGDRQPFAEAGTVRMRR